MESNVSCYVKCDWLFMCSGVRFSKQDPFGSALLMHGLCMVTLLECENQNIVLYAVYKHTKLDIVVMKA